MTTQSFQLIAKAEENPKEETIETVEVEVTIETVLVDPVMTTEVDKVVSAEEGKTASRKSGLEQVPKRGLIHRIRLLDVRAEVQIVELMVAKKRKQRKFVMCK